MWVNLVRPSEALSLKIRFHKGHKRLCGGERAEEENARIYIDRQSADLVSLQLMSSLFAKRLIAKTEPTFPHFAIAKAIDTTAFQTSNSLMRIEEELKKEKSDLKEN